MTSRIKRLINSTFYRNIFTLISATGIAQAISLLVYPVLTRIYTPAEHGLFSLYLSIIAISAIISTGKYELAIMIPKKQREGAGLSVLSIYISLIFSVLLFIFIALFKRQIPGWLGNENIGRWLYFVPLSTFMVAIFQTFSYWFNRKENYKIIAGANLSQSILNSAVKLSASKALSNGGGLMVGAIAGQVLGAIIYSCKVLCEGLGVFRGFSLKELKNLALKHSFFPRYSMFHRLTNNFSSNLPVFVFSLYFSADIVGFFGLGLMLINRPMNLVSSSLSKVFSQQMIDTHNRGLKIHKDVIQFVKRIAFIAIIPFVIIGIFAPALVTFIFGDKWHEAGVYMQIFSPWLFLVFLVSPINFLSDMLFRQRKAMLLEVAKFILRAASLLTGVLANDVYLALYLFSGTSFLVVLYTLYWYLKLARNADDKVATTGTENIKSAD